MVRLFVGLTLPEEVKRGLLAMMAGLEGVKWQREDQLHLTLKFIGEVSEPQAEDIGSALTLVPVTPFELALEKVDLFGNRRRPRMLWAGVRRENLEQLHYLHDKVERVLARCGLEPERRKFIPHVTLGRCKGKGKRIGRFLERHATYKSAPFRVERMVLFRSQLSHDGSHYSIVRTYPDLSNAVPA